MAEINDADLMTAITAGIEESSSLPVAQTHDEPVEETVEGDETGAEGTKSTEGVEGTEPETTEVEAEAQTDDKGVALRDEKGRFLKKQPEAETPEAKTAREAAEAAALLEKNKGKTPEQLAAEKTAATAAKKTKDPLTDPLPKDMKVETRERVQALIKIAKDADTKVAAVQADLTVFTNSIEAARCSPEQYGQSLTIIGLINSGDRAKQEQALTLLHNEYATLARVLGKPVAGVDMLADHADLKAEVQGGKLTKERAEEIAALRESTKIRTDVQQRASAEGAASTAAATELAAAKTALSTFEKATAATDAHWPAKKAFLVNSLRETFAAIAPKLWHGMFEKAYKALPKDFGKPAAAAAATASGTKKGTPLRAQTPAGGQVGAPKNALEAMNAGLATLGR